MLFTGVGASFSAKGKRERNAKKREKSALSSAHQDHLEDSNVVFFFVCGRMQTGNKTDSPRVAYESGFFRLPPALFCSPITRA